MPTISECAILSNEVYKTSMNDHVETKDGRKTTRWKVRSRDLKSSANSVSSFQYAVFESVETNEGVIAIRGTQEWQDFAIDDVMILQGLPPATTILAESLVATWKGSFKSVMVTGHSLGGALAIIAAAANNVKAVSFNAPGVSAECVMHITRQNIFTSLPQLGNLIKKLQNCLNGNPQIQNIRLNGDPVSSIFSTGARAGNTVELEPLGCKKFDLYCKHSMDTIIRSLPPTW
jgi:hypothetical protein